MNDSAASTTVIDSRGYSNGTAQQNTSVLHTTGKVGGALTFNGTSDYVNANTTFATVFNSDFSIGFWVNFTDKTGNGSHFLLGNHDGATYGTYVYFLEGQNLLGLDLARNNETTNDSVEIPNFTYNQWYFIAITAWQADETNVAVNFYVNGVLLQAGGIGDKVLSSLVGPSNIYIGTVNEAGAVYFSGSLDNITIFNKALTASEVALLYNSSRGTENFQLDDHQLSGGGAVLFSQRGL
jgi:hypothetical protein